ncbi:hypothetical protein EV286_11788 [Rhizobium sp. BK251]|nr:hypothetical protein EV286_11788 [Rhizobium sp. BK251]
MKSRGPYRRHSTQFKLQLCQDIRSGVVGRRDAQRTYSVSANLIQLWLTQFDRGELNDEEAEASVVAEYEARIAALERKVGQLTMELDLAKKTPRPSTVGDNERSFIVTGPRPAPSDGTPVFATVRRKPRSWDHTSDHAPVMIELDLPRTEGN